MRRLFWILLALLTTATACEAELDPECLGDSCVPYEASPLEIPETECYDGCVTDAVAPTMGELPCEVDAVLDNCRRCHTNPPQNGAPFPLDTYADTQQLYLGTTIWSRMKLMLDTDTMPAAPPLLTADEKAIVLDDWACQCAPPRDPAEICN